MHMCISRQWSRWECEDHWYFSQAIKIPSRPLGDPSCIHALHTRMCPSYTQAFYCHCASVWRLCVSSALTRHHLSCILTAFNQTLDSEIAMEPYSTGTAVTMVTVEVCDPPTSQRMQCCLFFMEKYQLCVSISSSPFLLSLACPCR